MATQFKVGFGRDRGALTKFLNRVPHSTLIPENLANGGTAARRSQDDLLLEDYSIFGGIESIYLRKTLTTAAALFRYLAMVWALT